MNETDHSSAAAALDELIILNGKLRCPYPEALRIIKAAIEKAYEQGREDEYQEWIRPNYPIRAAHEEKKLPPDWNKGLPVITHLSKPARASTKRHHYQAEDGFPCPCGKPIDHPIHIPRIEL